MLLALALNLLLLQELEPNVEHLLLLHLLLLTIFTCVLFLLGSVEVRISVVWTEVRMMTIEITMVYVCVCGRTGV